MAYDILIARWRRQKSRLERSQEHEKLNLIVTSEDNSFIVLCIIVVRCNLVGVTCL